MPYNQISGSDAEGNWRANQKQEIYTDPQPNPSFVAVMTDADREASKAAVGSMVYSSTDDHLYVYNGTEWKDVTTPS